MSAQFRNTFKALFVRNLSLDSTRNMGRNSQRKLYFGVTSNSVSLRINACQTNRSSLEDNEINHNEAKNQSDALSMRSKF